LRNETRMSAQLTRAIPRLYARGTPLGGYNRSYLETQKFCIILFNVSPSLVGRKWGNAVWVHCLMAPKMAPKMEPRTPSSVQLHIRKHRSTSQKLHWQWGFCKIVTPVSVQTHIWPELAHVPRTHYLLCFS